MLLSTHGDSTSAVQSSEQSAAWRGGAGRDERGDAGPDAWRAVQPGPSARARDRVDCGDVLLGLFCGDLVVCWSIVDEAAKEIERPKH